MESVPLVECDPFLSSPPLTSTCLGLHDLSGDVTSAELTSSRPKSGYGHRRHDVTSQHDVIDVTDRPQTRRERRVKHEPERR